ncbi:MAG: hypothetical protein HON70_15350, partial [Lentisphaerae bacterium]|nr:hypothetical protein [Lentisphaerota bacterium]
MAQSEDTDTDTDGLTDLVEQSMGTHPNNTDTDDDGVADGVEVAGANGDTPTNPLDSLDPLENRALTIAGAANYAFATQTGFGGGAGQLTFSAWLDPNTGAAVTGVILRGVDAADNTSVFALELDAGMLKFTYTSRSSTPATNSVTLTDTDGEILNTDGWVHVTARVINGEAVRLYVWRNGEDVVQTFDGLGDIAIPDGIALYVGDAPVVAGGTASSLVGRIDEVRVFANPAGITDAALQAERFAADSTSGTLYTYFRFDDSGNTAEDFANRITPLANLVTNLPFALDVTAAAVADVDDTDGLDETFDYLSADADGDGIADLWETKWNVAATAASDNDGDGLNDLTEYWLGLNPLQTDDADAILALDPDGDGTITELEQLAGTNPAVAFSVATASDPDVTAFRDADDNPQDVTWTDLDGSHGISAGDLIHVFFTETVQSVQVEDLTISGGRSLGTGATVTPNGTTIDIIVGTDATVLPTDTITVGEGVQDVAGTHLEPSAGDADNPVTLYDDLEPFVVQAVYTDENTIGVDAGDVLTITFGEPMNTGTVLTGADFLLNGTADANVFGTANVVYDWSVDGLTLTITMGTNPTLAQGATLAMAGTSVTLVDPAGNAGDPATTTRIVVSTSDYSVAAIERTADERLLDAPKAIGYALFSLNLSQNEAGEQQMLSSVTVQRSAGTVLFTSDVTFSLWRDVDNNGALDPAVDQIVPSTGVALTPGSTRFRIEVEAGEALPATDAGTDAGSDWLVVVEPKASCAWDDTVTFQIGAGGIVLSNLTSYPSAAVPTAEYKFRPSVTIENLVGPNWAVFDYVGAAITPDGRLNQVFDDVAVGEEEIVKHVVGTDAVTTFPNGLETAGSEYRNAVDIVFGGRLTDQSILTIAGSGQVRALAMSGDDTTPAADRTVLLEIGPVALTAVGANVSLAGVAVEDTDAVHVIRLVNDSEATAVTFTSITATNGGAAIRYASGTAAVTPLVKLTFRNDSAADVNLTGLAPVLESVLGSFTPEDLQTLGTGLALYADATGDGIIDDATSPLTTTDSVWGWFGDDAYQALLQNSAGQLGVVPDGDTLSVILGVNLSAQAEDGEAFQLRLGTGQVAEFALTGYAADALWATLRDGIDDAVRSTTLTVDTTAPAIRTVTVADANTNGIIDAGDQVAVLFSEPVDPATIALATIDTELDLSAGSFGASAIEWSTDGLTLTVTLGIGETIDEGATIDPVDAVTDYAGNADTTAVPVPLSLDLIGPQLLRIAWDDVDDTGHFNLGDTFTLVFSEPLADATVVTANLELSDGGSWGTSGIFKEGETQYLITLANDATVLHGMFVDPTDALTDDVGNVDETAAPGVQLTDTIAPVLTAVAALDNNDGPDDTGFSSGDQIDLTFGEPMASTVPATVSFGGVAVTILSSDWNTAGTVVTLTLGNNADLVYAGLIPAVGAFTDVAGNGATDAAPAEELTETVNPTVVDASDLNLAVGDVLITDVDGDGSISDGDTFQIFFSEMMDAATAGLLDNYTLSAGEWGDGATVAVTADFESVVITLGIDSDVSSGATIALSTNILDRHTGLQPGNALGGGQTVTVTDDTRPSLVAVDFTNITGGIGVDAGDIITLTFSEAMNTATVTVANMTATHADGTGSGFGTFALIDWDDDETVATITLGGGPTLADLDLIAPTTAVTDAAGRQALTTAVRLFLDIDYRILNVAEAGDDLDVPTPVGTAVSLFSMNLWQPAGLTGETLESVTVNVTTLTRDQVRLSLWADTNGNGVFDYANDRYIPAEITGSGAAITIEPNAAEVLPVGSGGPADYFVVGEILYADAVAFDSQVTFDIPASGVQLSMGALADTETTGALDLHVRTIARDEAGRLFANFALGQTTTVVFNEAQTGAAAFDVSTGLVTSFPLYLGENNDAAQSVAITFAGEISGTSALAIGAVGNGATVLVQQDGTLVGVVTFPNGSATRSVALRPDTAATHTITLTHISGGRLEFQSLAVTGDVDETADGLDSDGDGAIDDLT